MSGWLWRQLRGWRHLYMSGDHLESVVADVIAQGFRIWRVQRCGDQFECVVTESAYGYVQNLAGAYGLSIRTERQGGIPFRWQQIHRRPFLLLGLVTAVAMIVYATSHIWVVQVNDPDLSASAKAKMVQAVAKAGLKVGVSRSALDIAAIRRRTLMQLPEYSWIGIRVQGVVASLDGIRFVTHPPEHLSLQLVASHPGRVSAVYVYMGDPQVRAGEMVSQGQTLIAGVVRESSGDAKSPVSHSLVTPAEGVVMADVTYRARVFQPWIEHTWQSTAERVVHRYIELSNGEMVPVWGFEPLPFEHFTVQKIVRPLHFAGVEWPVRMVDLVYNKRVSRTIRLTRRQAVRRARERAMADIGKMVPKSASRVQDQVRVTLAPNGVWVSVTWVMNQNIAVPGRSVKPS
ncbi:MAG: hypothetical protein C7B45_02325 [Sulfobacillus acidophilus]|uniref:Sporulation protein YqfD n=1 Tax=Sulfobacillus acidophilus TaxID=53633 RepID=A0A2T2WN33_9FIRM|nr:MAG: hypothetical protein C7B45_02325 [Sulfobacillus acidophilus]